MRSEPFHIDDIDKAYSAWEAASRSLLDQDMWRSDPRYILVITRQAPGVQWSFDGVDYDDMDYDGSHVPPVRTEWYLCRPPGVEEMELRKRSNRYQLPELVCSSEPVYAVMDEIFREGGGYTMRPCEIAAAEREADDIRQAADRPVNP